MCSDGVTQRLLPQQRQLTRTVPVKIPGKAVKLEHLDTKLLSRFYLLWEKAAFFSKELMSSCGLIFSFSFFKAG